MGDATSNGNVNVYQNICLSYILVHDPCFCNSRSDDTDPCHRAASLPVTLICGLLASVESLARDSNLDIDYCYCIWNSAKINW